MRESWNTNVPWSIIRPHLFLITAWRLGVPQASRSVEKSESHYSDIHDIFKNQIRSINSSNFVPINLIVDGMAELILR